MFLFTLVYLCFFPFSQDESCVKIHVEIEGQNANVVRYYLPNKYFFDAFKSENYEDIKGEKQFDFKIPLESSSFIGLRFNNEDGIPLAASPGDSISIKVVRSQNSNYPTYSYQISGSNTIAHNIYLTRFYPAGKNLGFLDDLPKKTKTYSDYYVKAKKYIDSIVYVWDSLRLAKKITPEVYELYRADTRGCLYDVASRRMSLVKPKDTGWVSYTKWLQLKQVINYYADASNPIYLKTFVGVHVYQNYLQSILKNDDAIEDSLLKSSDLGYYYYYDTAFQKQAWGEMLWHLKEFFPTSSSPEDINDVKVFKKYHPNSIYLKKAEKFDDSILTERKSISKKIVLDEKNYQSLKALMSSINGDYFFIDVWATWCIPCVQEFNSYTTLSKFLSTKNIEQVFLSVNKVEDKTAWKSFVEKNYLGGYHFLINEKVQKDLFKVLSEGKDESSFFIPQYLLYDKKLDKFYIDLPRPSTGVALQQVINDLLKDGKLINKEDTR